MSYADSVSTNKRDLGAVWKKIKKMKGQVVDPSTIYGRVTASTARTRPRRSRSPRQRYYSIVSLAETSDCDSLLADMRQRRREMERDYSDPEPDDSLTVNSLLTLGELKRCLLYTSPSPRDDNRSRMPSSA